ncbi:MAG TPA: lamin tail domain-containing protein, partial [Chitinophagales bacterium]|nr:lamin tail domain-containing protein [Chitinophagales bacterium]
MRHTLLLLLLGAMVCTPMQAQIVINEASNRNASQTADEDGDFGDWLELYNAGVGSVNLEDFGLSDDPSDPLMWTLPDITLDPGAFLLIYASGKDRKPDGGIDH